MLAEERNVQKKKEKYKIESCVHDKSKWQEEKEREADHDTAKASLREDDRRRDARKTKRRGG